MDLQHIPLSNLKIAAVNVRHGRKLPDVSDILPSIRARGVLQPLLVRPNDEGFEIIAGRRRYFAASKVAEEQGAAPDTVLAAMRRNGQRRRYRRSGSIPHRERGPSTHGRTAGV
jgi:ParB-like chromosome segregation protein Spo0J